MSAHPRLSLNQATIKRADLPTAPRVTREAGIGSIGLWREPVAQIGLTSGGIRNYPNSSTAGRGAQIAGYPVCDEIIPLPPDALLARA